MKEEKTGIFPLHIRQTLVTVLIENDNKITELSEFLRKKIGMATGSASAYNLVKAMSEKGLL